MASLAGRISGTTTPRKLLKFEIRPDDGFILLRSSPSEDRQTFNINGTVVLMTSETIPQVKDITVRLEGIRQTLWFPYWASDRPQNSYTQSVHCRNRDTFITREHKISLSNSTLAAGNHAFLFEFELPGDLPESIEGIHGSYIIYQLRATASRGRFKKDLFSEIKHIRIIRPLTDGHAELIQEPNIVSGTWPDKVNYEFRTSSKIAIYGDKIMSTIDVMPLNEKVQVIDLYMGLVETQKVKTDPGPRSYVSAPGGGDHDRWRKDVEVASIRVDRDQTTEFINEATQVPVVRFNAPFPIPKSLNQCRQSAESEWLATSHTLFCTVKLKNPDGHISELLARHRIKILISSDMPLDDHNNIVEPPSIPGRSESLLSDLQAAPPAYASHTLDRLYDDVDICGFASPRGAMSSAATPSRAFSRRSSAEDVPSFAEEPQGGHQPNPQTLATRLTNLQEARGHTNGIPEEVDHAESAGDVASLGVGGSRQHSLGSYNMTALERITSYDTAVRKPMRTPPQAAPPSYQQCTSKPPSPR